MKIDFHVDEVVPHEGVMSLLDRVVDYGDDWLEAELRIGPHTLFLEPGGVPAWVGIEYMAQAIAAFAGVLRRKRGLPAAVGFLVGTRRYDCDISAFPEGCTLKVRVEREFQADNGLGVFACSIAGKADGGQAFNASAALNVFQPDNVDEFLEQGPSGRPE